MLFRYCNPIEVLMPCNFTIGSMPRLLSRSWLINNDRAPSPHLLTIYHDDTPHYYCPSCIHNASTMK